MLSRFASRDALLALCGWVVAILSLPSSARAVDENTPGWFAFIIPSLDNSPAAVDLSWMSPERAGARGRVRIVDGHYADADGSPMRFFGTNVTFDGALPPKDVAPLVAAHLRRLGFNLVRFHHLDTNKSPRGLLKADKRTIDPAMLDLMEYFIDQLEQNGIYINVNLHVGRSYPGLPSGLAYSFRYGKILDRYYQPFIDLQKEYARDLLTHRNPYTGLTLAEDPAVLVVERNNENTLMKADPSEMDALPDPLRQAFLDQWHEWLTSRYATDEALRAAWLAGLEPPGPEMLQNGDFSGGLNHWTVQKVAPVVATAEVRPGAGPGGSSAFVGQITTPGTVNHAFQTFQKSLTLEEGILYTLSFDGLSTGGFVVKVNTMLSVSPYTNNGLSKSPAFTASWTHYEYTFAAANTQPGNSRVTFNFGKDLCEDALARVSLRRGASQSTFDRINAITRAAAPLPISNPTAGEWADFQLFLYQTDCAHSQEIRDYLRDTLGVQAYLADTQASYGQMGGMYREASLSSYIDMHAYWQHPQFPGEPWDPVDWTIKNTPMAADAAGGTVATLARMRVEGMPFSVSEYNHPAPSWHACELFPMLASFGSFQDWDAIYQFCYRNGGGEWDVQSIQKYFQLDGNPGQLAFAPWAAVAFRTRAFATAQEAAILSIPSTPEDFLENHSGWDVESAWSGAGAIDRLSALAPLFMRRTAGITDPSLYVPPTVDQTHQTSALSPIAWDPAEQVYQAVAPRAVVLTGAIADPSTTRTLGPFQLTFQATSNGFATFAAASLDGEDLESSEKILIVLANRVENTNMVWNADYTSVGNQWGTAPARVEGVGARIVFAGHAAFAASALDGTGAVKQGIPVARGTNSITFDAGPRRQTPWYLLTPSHSAVRKWRVWR